MTTALRGFSVMDAALLMVAVNEKFPQIQTSEHLAAVDMMQISRVFLLQNKIDLMKKSQTQLQHEEIKNFLKDTVAENEPIIPISAILRYNLEVFYLLYEYLIILHSIFRVRLQVICEYICNMIPAPLRSNCVPARMITIRTFNVNILGTKVIQLKGGVFGGKIVKGTNTVCFN